MCNCEAIELWAENQFMPLRFLEDSNTYILDIGNDLSLKIDFCFLCGERLSAPTLGFAEKTGHFIDEVKSGSAVDNRNDSSSREPSVVAGNKSCECSLLSKYASDPNLFIEFNEEYNHFELIFDEWIQIFQYCPFCGGILPESRTADLFPAPSEIERGNIEERLKFAKTVDDVIAILGQPDSIYTASETRSALKKRGLYYKRVTKNCALSVQELEDDTIALFILSSGKDELFTTPSKAIFNGIKKKLKLAKSVDDVILILGIPEKKYYFANSRRVRHKLIYINISETFKLVVLEKVSGEIELSAERKLKKELLSQQK